MSRVAAVIFLALVFPVAAAAGNSVYVEPVAPTSLNVILLHVAGGPGICSPSGPFVTFHGNDINVALTASPIVFSCYILQETFDVRIPLGALAPGSYRVSVQISGTAYGSTAFDVADGTPPFFFTPRLFKIGGGTFSLYVDSVSCRQSICFPRAVTFDNVSVTDLKVDGPASGTAPPHAPGPVTVSVLYDGGYEQHSFGGVRYYDPNLPPEPDTFERVLFPIVYSGPGAYGSAWTTEATIKSSDFEPQFWRDVAAHPIAPAGFAPLDPTLQYPQGLIVHPARSSSPWLSYTLRVRETKHPSSYGTDLPVVPEASFTGSMHFYNVPVVPGTRTTLRAYALDSGPSAEVYVSVTRSGKYLAAYLPLSQPTPDSPAFAIIPDLDAAFPAQAESMDIEVSSLQSPIWALITVTTNDTQQVTVIR